ncbi:MAG: DUF4157 domain-containing protein [Methylococcaceae bacterium]
MAELIYQRRGVQATSSRADGMSQRQTGGKVLQDNRESSQQLKQLMSATSASAVQRIKEEEEPLQGQFAGQQTKQLEQPAAPKPNHTGLPDNLKTGIESLSGMSMDNVRVHYNSAKPAQLNALAYAQGADIHVASGQEQHLPHEAWHVVQQAQGRVKPTMQMTGGVPVNNDVGLEREADVMGAKAMSHATDTAQRNALTSTRTRKHNYALVQRAAFYHGGGKAFVDSAIANPHTAKASEGELGSKGMYYWKGDENAALVSAIIYNAAKDWAVMKITTNPKVITANTNNTKLLYFQSDMVAPKKTIGGVSTTVLGIHYQFIQNNLGTKLGEANADDTIEGTLDEEYRNMTGREFLDSFDFVVSPTKAANYEHKELQQARANDTGLTNIIYGTADDGSKNTIIKTWEGKITDAEHQSTIENMGLGKKNEVPSVLLEKMNGKNGTVVIKL